MEVIISIDKLLVRGKEIFDAYTSSGKEVDLLPLLKQYGIEDKKVYTIDKAYKYLLMYVTSKNIKEEELAKYNEIEKVDPKLIFKRGKKALLMLIKSNNDEKQLYLLAASFARVDGRVNPYPISYVRASLDYYIKNSKNQKLIDTYYAVVELTKNNKKQEFDLKLIQEIIKLNDIESAVAFIKNINISDVHLNNLVNSYCILYPANTTEIIYLRQLMSIYNDEKQNKLIPKDENETRGSIKELKRILEDYLIKDVVDIKEILDNHQISIYEFREVLKDAIKKNDPILISLIDKYHVKENILIEYRNSIVTNIGNFILNGINFGNGYRAYNVYDFLIQNNKYDIETIIETVKELFNPDDSDYIIEFLKNMDLTDAYNSIDDLSSSIGIFSKNGRNLSDDEKNMILSYIDELGLPLNNSVFFATCERYIDGDLIINNKKIL